MIHSKEIIQILKGKIFDISKATNGWFYMCLVERNKTRKICFILWWKKKSKASENEINIHYMSVVLVDLMYHLIFLWYLGSSSSYATMSNPYSGIKHIQSTYSVKIIFNVLYFYTNERSIKTIKLMAYYLMIYNPP